MKKNKFVLKIKQKKPKVLEIQLSPSNAYSRLISFRIGWFDPLAVHRTLISLFQHHNSKASVAPKHNVVVVLA